MKSRIWLVALALGIPLGAAAQTPPAGQPAAAPRAEVLVVGTYHMANPGRDIFNMEADDWAGADFLTEWIRRNLRIYTHIAQLVESPQERVLVLYGAGHLGWLQRDVASSPNLRLRKLAELAP